MHISSKYRKRDYFGQLKTEVAMESSGTEFKLYGVSSNFTQGPPVTQFENFGDFENDASSLKIKGIDICDVQLDADLFTNKLNQIDTSELEEIRLTKVSYTKKFKPVFLPALRKFFFKSKTFQDEVFETTSIFFFQKIQNESWRRSDIGSLGVDITFQIEDALVFEIDHAQKSLFVALEVVQAQEIVKNCSMLIEHLGLHVMPIGGRRQEEIQKLDLSIIPRNLKCLELHFEDNDWNRTQNFLAENFADLEEFIYKPRGLYAEPFAIALQKLPPKLKKLCLYRCTVSVDPNFESEVFDVVTLFDTVIEEPYLKFRAKHLNILCYCRSDMTLNSLDTFLNSSEPEFVFFEPRVIGRNSKPNSSYVSVCALTENEQMRLDEAGNLKLPEHGIVFTRVNKEEPSKWVARREFVEERDFLIQKFSGVPIGGGGHCSTIDFEHGLIGHESFCFVIPPRSFQRRTNRAPPPPVFRYPFSRQAHLIRQLHLEEVKIQNDDDLRLAELELLEFITLKNCVCTCVDRNAQSWTPEVHPRVLDGFALNHLKNIKKLRGLTVIGTRLEPKYPEQTSPLVNVLDFLMIDGGSSHGDGDKDKIGKRFNIGNFNAKQVVVLGMTVSNDWMEGILKMPALELALIGNVERHTNSRDVENFLEVAGLECWEPSFILQKFLENGAAQSQWKGKYMQDATKFGCVAEEFKFLKSEFNFFENTVKTFQNSEEYLHDRHPEAVAVNFELQNLNASGHLYDSFVNPRQNKPELKPEETFDRVSMSLKHRGIYVQPKTRNDRRYGVNYSDFDGFSDTATREPIKILKFEQTTLLPQQITRAFGLVNLQALTELHLTDVIINEEMPQLDLTHLKVIDLSLQSVDSKVLENETNFVNFLSRFVSLSPETLKLSSLLRWKLDKISLQVDHQKYLEIDHLVGKLHLAKLSFLSKVFDPEVKLRTLVLNCIGDLDLSRINKTSLEILSIQNDGVCDWEEVEEGLQGMSNLVEFYFYRKPFGKKMQVRLDRIPSSVKYLCLSHVAFSASIPAQPLTLQHLVLLEVSLPPTIFASFPKYFNPKKLVVHVTNSRQYGRSPTDVPNLDFVHAVTSFCETEWLYLSAFEETGSPDVESKVEAFLRKALVPKPEVQEWRHNSTPLVLERRGNRWRNCEIQETSISRMMDRCWIFEGFLLGRNCDQNLFKNKLVHFDGFGPEVTRVRSIDICGVIVDADFLRSELQRVGTCAIENVSFHRVTFLGTPLEMGEIPFPNLKHFKIKNCSFGTNHVSYELCWDDVKTKLWFRRNSDSFGDFRLRDLWTLGVHVIVDGLEVCPTENKLLTKLDDGNSLVINAVGLKSLTFESHSVKPVTFPLTLTYLSVDTPMSWKELMTKLADHQNLIELHFGTEGYCTGRPKDVEIGKLPPNLKVLKLSNATVTFCVTAEATFRFPQPKTLESLSFEFCTLPQPNFASKCSQMFDLPSINFKKVEPYQPS